jgi:hypothetical protein
MILIATTVAKINWGSLLTGVGTLTFTQDNEGSNPFYPTRFNGPLVNGYHAGLSNRHKGFESLMGRHF